MVTYRIEQRRRNTPTMQRFRERARSLLADLDDAVRRDPEMRRALLEARRELDRAESSARGSLGQEVVDGGGQVVDAEGLR